MEEALKSPHLLRFEAFEVNLRSGELYRDGQRVKLPEHSFQILAILLERPVLLPEQVPPLLAALEDPPAQWFSSEC